MYHYFTADHSGKRERFKKLIKEETSNNILLWLLSTYNLKNNGVLILSGETDLLLYEKSKIFYLRMETNNANLLLILFVKYLVYTLSTNK